MRTGEIVIKFFIDLFVRQSANQRMNKCSTFRAAAACSETLSLASNSPTCNDVSVKALIFERVLHPFTELLTGCPPRNARCVTSCLHSTLPSVGHLLPPSGSSPALLLLLPEYSL